MTDEPRQNRSYIDVRGEIRDADLLLFRRRNWYTRMIAVAGRSQYVHAALAGWWKDRLMCVEMTSGGGRAQLLSNIVDRWPGVCDVYRANAARRRFSRERAVAAMIAITGKPYGWLNLCRAALLHLPVFRLLGSARHRRQRDNRLAAVLFAGRVDGVPGGRGRSGAQPGRPSDRAGRLGEKPVLRVPVYAGRRNEVRGMRVERRGTRDKG